MAYDNRHTINMRLSDDVWQILQAIKSENDLETDVQTIRYLIRTYYKKQETR